MTAKFAIVPADALFDDRLIPQQVRVLGILAYYGGNKENGCWPSYRTLAAKVGISRRLLVTYIGHLCECGYVVKVAQHRKDGSQSTNIYMVKNEFDLGLTNGDAQVHHPENPASTGGDAQVHASKENQTNLTKENVKKKPRKLVSIQEWETEKGSPLCLQMLTSWIRSKGYDPKAIDAMIEEFRTRMMASDNRYSDYRAAFQDWFGRGFLSKKPEQCKLVSNPSRRASISI